MLEAEFYAEMHRYGIEPRIQYHSGASRMLSYNHMEDGMISQIDFYKHASCALYPSSIPDDRLDVSLIPDPAQKIIANTLPIVFMDICYRHAPPKGVSRKAMRLAVQSLLSRPDCTMITSVSQVAKMILFFADNTGMWR